MPDDDGKPAACEGATVAAMSFEGCDVKDSNVNEMQSEVGMSRLFGRGLGATHHNPNLPRNPWSLIRQEGMIG